MAVQVAAITEADLPAVGEFMQRHLNDRIAAGTWHQALTVPWRVEAPNHGFLLRDGDRLVGAYLAFYSVRTVAGRAERFCNLGGWCVLPEYRFHGPRLLKALLAQPGYHFTDLSPSGSVVAINTRLGFTQLDTATALLVNLPWPAAGRVTSDPAALAATLTGTQRTIYHDHLAAAAAHHVLLRRDERWCYVIFRRDRRRGHRGFASVLHASDPALFRSLIRPFAGHLLRRYGLLATLVELRVAGGRPGWSRLLTRPRPKLFRSPSLRPEQIDNLYSELVCLAW